MIEQDTIRLLRECDAGVKMGISSIEDVLDDISNKDFKDRLTRAKEEHCVIDGKLEKLLNKYQDEGKDPNIMAKGMSWIKTNVMMTMNNSDETVADLITDGCNMGVKTLNKYLNKYKAADEDSKEITKELIKSEDTLATDIRLYL
ncbi:MAG: hypothetical protein E7235_07290 [Lachnospiraceae bacterium]|nr:hypothetical protein [Lachnospiraceae bacterium]